jgi:hypothetical protein
MAALSRFQTFAVPSALAVTRRLLSGEKATLNT